MPWGSREFVVKDCDGRLLAFGANLYPELVRERSSLRPPVTASRVLLKEGTPP
jgi:hypothetical protein